MAEKADKKNLNRIVSTCNGQEIVQELTDDGWKITLDGKACGSLAEARCKALDKPYNPKQLSKVERPKDAAEKPAEESPPKNKRTRRKKAEQPPADQPKQDDPKTDEQPGEADGPPQAE